MAKVENKLALNNECANGESTNELTNVITYIESKRITPIIAEILVNFFINATFLI